MEASILSNNFHILLITRKLKRLFDNHFFNLHLISNSHGVKIHSR